MPRPIGVSFHASQFKPALPAASDNSAGMPIKLIICRAWPLTGSILTIPADAFTAPMSASSSSLASDSRSLDRGATGAFISSAAALSFTICAVKQRSPSHELPASAEFLTEFALLPINQIPIYQVCLCRNLPPIRVQYQPRFSRHQFAQVTGILNLKILLCRVYPSFGLYCLPPFWL